jgi:prepilin-type N-terminal cleavage/methylation domain-containing protein
MSDRGFTLVELLVASLIAVMVAGGALVLAEGARTALAVEPASMDTARRLREGVEAIAAAIASAGGERGIGDARGSLAQGLPVIRLVAGEGEDVFSGLVVTRAVHGGRGRVVADQPGPAGSLTLAMSDGQCPRIESVCGFREGDVAVVFDGRGHVDVFVVGAVSEALSRITPRAPLAHAYRAGAWVVEVRHERLVLLRQPDGSRSLSRITAAGAREPVLDGVTSLEVRAWGRAAAPGLYEFEDDRFAQYGLPPPAPTEADPDGMFPEGMHCMAARIEGTLQTTLSSSPGDEDGLVELGAADMEDGPWCPHDDAPARYDADWFRLRRVDVRLRVEALPPEFRGPSGPLFTRSGSAQHDAPRWIRDRAIEFTVAVGR